jgi:hypothetical protein
VTWIHVTDPTAEDTNAGSPPDQTATTSHTYQEVASNTLEALSTAAADQTTSYPPQGTAYYTAANSQSDAHPEYGFVQADASSTAAGGTANYFLGNATTQNETEPSLIDPNLEATANTNNHNNNAEQDGETGGPQAGRKPQGTGEGAALSDSRVAIALRNFNELQS